MRTPHSSRQALEMGTLSLPKAMAKTPADRAGYQTLKPEENFYDSGFKAVLY
jgi:hypothetical protein